MASVSLWLFSSGISTGTGEGTAAGLGTGHCFAVRMRPERFLGAEVQDPAGDGLQQRWGTRAAEPRSAGEVGMLRERVVCC